MPVDTTHPAYDLAKPDWQLVRDTIAGSRAVKARGDAYLPKLYKQRPEDYDAYRMRAVFFGATSRTAEAYVGMIMRKKPTITVAESDPMKQFLRSIDRRGTEFVSYAETIVRELVTVSRAGTLVDWSEPDARPYLTHYATEDIINWRWETVAGQSRLVYVVLHECSHEFSAATGEKPPVDEYVTPTYHQWRVLKLIEGRYTVEVWRKKQEDAKLTAAPRVPEFVLLERRQPTRRNLAMDSIPFVFHSMDADPVAVSPPLLADLADVNLSHYRQSADYENGLHMAGLPTPWAAGFTDETSKELTLGTTQAWVTDKADAKCGFLEVTGAGFGQIRTAMEAKEKHMAALGARALEPQKADAEAYETVMLRTGAETSALTIAAQRASASLSQILQWAAWWIGTAKTPADLTDADYIAINQDLLSAKAPPQLITALVAALQGGAISFETFFYNMKRGEMYDEDTDLETEQERIEAQTPPAPIDPVTGEPTTGGPGRAPGAPSPQPKTDPNAPPKPGEKAPAKKAAKKAAAKPPEK